MKNLILLWLVLLASTAQAAVLTLNNNNPSPGQHSTFAAAQSAANAGDTILVHGSPTLYANFLVTKSLMIIGQGHKPRTVLAQGASVDLIDISVSNVRIQGMKATGIAGFNGVTDVTIENCFLNYVGVGVNGNNWLIKNNVFQNSGIQAITLAGASNATNLIVANNIINSANALSAFGGTGTKLFSNNIFTWSGAGVLMGGGESANNTTFENNIFYGITPNAGTQTNCVYNNNLTYLTSNNTLPPAGQTGSNNLVNVNPLFVNIFSIALFEPSTFLYIFDYHLGVGSPGLGAGTGGTNLGIYESDNEFSMTGEPARPQTTTVTTPATVPLGGAIQTSFTIRKATPNAQ
ncbi:MAG: right-handed parallel beta-helix repeat-containing protein [Lewinellaceae bacterium]|nr:right-handed parallel beta-helix repeat-containing protein [Lewinellaceae bacterium]